MSEAAGVPAICRQAPGLPRHHVALGREPRGVDTGHKLVEEVWQSGMLDRLDKLTPEQRPEPPQSVHRRSRPLHPWKHRLRRDGPRPVSRSRDHNIQRKPLYSPESRPVRHEDLQEGS